MTETDIYKSFDASVWAHEFCDIFEKNHGFRPDEGWMITWFASALMRGYDEHRWQSDEYKAEIAAVLTT